MSRTDPQLTDIEEQIAETREALGQTVEELAAKADVPGRAKAKARETAERLRAVEHRTREKAALARGRTRERALHARDATQERAALTAGRVRDSAGAHLPGRGNGKAAAPSGTTAPSSRSTELTPTGTTGAHRVGPETAGAEPEESTGSARRPLAVSAALAVVAAVALTWARRHQLASRAAAPPPLPEHIPWRVRASTRACLPRAE